jgi:outer membrane protein assembly factor BamB
VAGVSAEDGSLLWDTTDWKISIATCPSPVALPGDKIFLCGGYNSGALILHVTKEDGKHRAATARRLEPAQFGSTQHTPVLYRDHLFAVREIDKQLVCLDLEGNEVWASGAEHRFGLGPYLIADDLIYVLSDDGLLTMAQASPDGYKPLAQAQVLQGHDAWGPMALVAGRLVCRDLTQMVCIDVAEELP